MPHVPSFKRDAVAVEDEDEGVATSSLQPANYIYIYILISPARNSTLQWFIKS
jgi:hypothetical protein